MWQYMQTEKPAPSPNKHFQTVKQRVHRQLVEAIDISEITRWKPDRLRREVRALARQMVNTSDEPLSDEEKTRLLDELMEEVFGLGPLDPLMADPYISDILVNGPNTVYIERDGRLQPTDVVFADNAHLIQIIQRIAGWVGR